MTFASSQSFTGFRLIEINGPDSYLTAIAHNANSFRSSAILTQPPSPNTRTTPKTLTHTMPRQGDGSSDNGPFEATNDIIHGAGSVEVQQHAFPPTPAFTVR
jgi:hypothetical protein